MREIKFRAWDKENNRMIYFGQAHFRDEYNELVCGCDWDEYGFGYADLGLDDDAPIMQYTGLKDSKGVDIYEGDILKCEIGQDEKVEFKNGMFIGRYRATPLYDIWLNQEIKVIGNIYEDKK